MTARFSWNQRNARGHRPRLQFSLQHRPQCLNESLRSFKESVWKSTISKKRLVKVFRCVGIDFESGQILQSKVSVQIQLRPFKPRLQVACTAEICRQDIQRGPKSYATQR